MPQKKNILMVPPSLVSLVYILCILPVILASEAMGSNQPRYIFGIMPKSLVSQSAKDCFSQKLKLKQVIKE
jgi:hypothetical protein